MALGQRAQAVAELGIELERIMGAHIALRIRAGTVGRERQQDRRTGQVVMPEALVGL